MGGTTQLDKLCGSDCPSGNVKSSVDNLDLSSRELS